MTDYRQLSAAVDEIYALRALLADASLVFTDVLEMSSLSGRRRIAIEKQVQRLVSAANGGCSNEAHRKIVLGEGFSQKAVLKSVGADECLTNPQWLEQAGLEAS